MITRIEKHAEKSNIMPSWIQQFSTKVMSDYQCTYPNLSGHPFD